MVEIIRCKPGESGEDQTKQRKRILAMHNKPCIYQGKEYRSLSTLADKFGVCKTTISRAIKLGNFRGRPIALIKGEK